jgi:hypothetical protein
VSWRLPGDGCAMRGEPAVRLMAHSRFRLPALLAAATVAAIGGGCASPTRVGPPVPPVRATDQSAYHSAPHHPTVSSRETWKVGGEDLDVTLLVPTARGAYPLVIYLPGLGESSAAGLAWRRAWAEAGYAVLSVQPASTGTAVWSSERARAFDFRTLALEHFSPRTFPSRLTALQGVVDEAGRRQRQGGDGPYSRIDVSRIAIAGYDLGAEAAMVVAGQSAPETAIGPAPQAIKSVIALSPYADFAGMGVEARFREIHMPVLSVTSPDDTDAYGLVTTAAVRRAPFEHMPPGRKYLLLLASAPHSLLGGRDEPVAEREEGTSGSRMGTSQESSSRRRAGGAGGGSAGGSDRSSGRDGRGARGGADSGPGSDVGIVSARPNLAGLWATQLRNVQGVTTAYLDATVKNDPLASEWLSRDANRWLGGSANLMVK